jgi:chromosome segregation ATPase
MISVDQIHRLETRIERVLGMLAELRAANDSLASQLQAANANTEETGRKLEESESSRLVAEQRLLDLEGKLSRLRTDQEEIEATINRALHQLDELEVDLSEPEAGSPSPTVPAESEPAADAAAMAAPAERAEDSLAGEPSDWNAAAVDQAEAAGEEQSDEADATATTGEEAAPSREGAELDIF